MVSLLEKICRTINTLQSKCLKQALKVDTSPLSFVIFVSLFLLLVDIPSKEKVDALSYADKENPHYMGRKKIDTEVLAVSENAFSKTLLTYSERQLKTPHESHLKFYSPYYETKKSKRLLLDEIGKRYGIPKGVLFFQHHIESRGACPSRSNHKGAVGCFQFLEPTAREFGLINNKVDYRTNILASADAAARYMAWLALVMYKDQADLSDWEQMKHVLAAYNAGYGRVTRTGKPKIPRFIETLEYVKNIESLVKGNSVLVERGDSLRTLSEKTGVSIEYLLKGNPAIRSSADLRYGQVINLPDKDGMSEIIVKQGMSLYALEKGTGIPVSFIAHANNIKNNDVIHIGQTLKLPVFNY